MTSVQLKFRYQGRVQPESIPRMHESHRDYGIRAIKIDEKQNVLTLEYDATRLDAKGVEAVLRRMGIPVVELVRE